ncbi:hypothetical protein KBC75_03395 [Candidatus Shapirobacteria bacterium]|nr:hypothetical protein [Candidatus Shapirobacteria bacterium]
MRAKNTELVFDVFPVILEDGKNVRRVGKSPLVKGLRSIDILELRQKLDPSFVPSAVGDIEVIGVRGAHVYIAIDSSGGPLRTEINGIKSRAVDFITLNGNNRRINLFDSFGATSGNPVKGIGVLVRNIAK